CGGGTLLVEAAAMARGRAPGGRRGFAFEKLSAFNVSAWQAVKAEETKKEKQPELRLHGSDTDPKALNAARRNLAEAGIERWVTLERSDILERTPPSETGVLVANPPYGERIGTAEALASFYPKLGDALKKRFAGWRCYFFTADLRLPKLIRLQPSRRTPLFNGALECRLYEFAMVAGSHRGRADAAARGGRGD
ncbi:MAG TPA: methyltransferase, partial [Burkholderiales bacterium]|nr:methyltransferase [Burkholderiales bacterium]